jgi:hypothetical protein
MTPNETPSGNKEMDLEKAREILVKALKEREATGWTPLDHAANGFVSGHESRDAEVSSLRSEVASLREKLSRESRERMLLENDATEECRKKDAEIESLNRVIEERGNAFQKAQNETLAALTQSRESARGLVEASEKIAERWKDSEFRVNDYLPVRTVSEVAREFQGFLEALAAYSKSLSSVSGEGESKGSV